MNDDLVFDFFAFIGMIPVSLIFGKKLNRNTIPDVIFVNNKEFRLKDRNLITARYENETYKNKDCVK